MDIYLTLKKKLKSNFFVKMFINIVKELMTYLRYNKGQNPPFQTIQSFEINKGKIYTISYFY